MSNSLLDKLKKVSTVKGAASFSKSEYTSIDKQVYSTSVPALNVAISGEIDGGISSGVTIIAGPSKHFKSLLALIFAKAFQDAHPEGVVIFYDSEFGMPMEYIESIGLDPDRILHVPIMNLEELKFDIVKQVEEMDKKDEVFIVMDSLGNIASKKELEDTLAEKGTADMSRAKQMKSLFRMITPYLTTKDIPFVGINHTYKTQEMFSKDVVSGGTGLYYSADNIFIMGRQQEKEGKDLAGWNFIINIEKSRTVIEKAKIPITVKFDGGLNKYSAMLDWALEAGHLHKPSNGYYQIVDMETGEIAEKKLRAKQLDSKFFKGVAEHPKFKAYIKENYQLAGGALISDDLE